MGPADRDGGRMNLRGDAPNSPGRWSPEDVSGLQGTDRIEFYATRGRRAFGEGRGR